MADIRCVRLKPLNPDRGHLMATWQAPRPWREVFRAGEWKEFDLDTEDGKLAVDYLRTVRMDPNDHGSALAFDIMTREDARALRLAEQRGQLEPVVRPRAPKPKVPQAPKSKASVELNRPAPSHELDLPPAEPEPAPAPAPKRKPGRKKMPTERPKK